MNDAEKQCSTCGEVKSLDEFSIDRTHRDGRSSACSVCSADRQRRWREANKDRHKQNRLRSNLKLYGLTIEEYDAMVAAQNGTCAICDGPPRGKGDRLHVDHSHKTGKPRALLCSPCNIGIGVFQENISLLAKAAMYLNDWRDHGRVGSHGK